jgi:hypothetical protein
MSIGKVMLNNSCDDDEWQQCQLWAHLCTDVMVRNTMKQPGFWRVLKSPVGYHAYVNALYGFIQDCCIVNLWQYIPMSRSQC